MFEIDKKLIAVYRECIANTLAELREGEEVDYESICIVESEKLQKHITKEMVAWEDKHPIKLPDKMQSYYNPKMPYFQQF